MGKRPVILWLWWYDRFDLVKPLLPIQSQTDNFYLFYRFPRQENLSFNIPGKTLYWTKFESPYKLLEEVRPDKVVFMGVENLLTIALLSACRKQKIPTVFLSHGVTSTYSAAKASEQSSDTSLIDKRYNKKHPAYQSKKIHSIRFYLDAFLKAGLHEKGFMIRFLVNSLRYRSIHERLYHTKSVYRLTDQYLVFTRHLARYLFERDNVPDSGILETGPYPLDELFKNLSLEANMLPQQRYFLMIDQPINAKNFVEVENFWCSLADSCKHLGYKVVVKLHPSNYSKNNPIEHENIKWIRDEGAIQALIMQASACLGYFSTLLLPIIWFKPVGLFNPTNQPLTNEWTELKVATALSYPTVQVEELEELTKENPKGDFLLFEKRYLFKADGNSAKRLQEVLLGNQFYEFH